MKVFLKTIMLALFGVCMGSFAWAHGDHEHGPVGGHLSYKQNTLHIHASFPHGVSVGDAVPLVLQAKDGKTHSNVELNDQVDVVLWMPSMGHGSAPTQVERILTEDGQIIPGAFYVRDVYFTMGGEWEIRVTLTDAQGVQETKSFKVKLGGDDHGGHH